MARSRVLPCLFSCLVLLAAPRARAGDVTVHGLLDVVAAQRGPALESNRLVRKDTPFDAYGTRLFVEGTVNPALVARAQIVMRDASGLYVDGAYAIWTPRPPWDLNVEAGKIPWPIGTWGPRVYSDKNPLIGAPLMYQYHSTLPWADVPWTLDALLAQAGGGQLGIGTTLPGPAYGMAIVDDAYWDVGVAVTGSRRPLEYSAAVLAGAPGWGSTQEDDNSGKTIAGRVGFLPHPALRVGMSGSWGPYLGDWVSYALPPEKRANDYAQKLLMADAQVSLAHVELNAEGAVNAWETPFAGELPVRAGYVEGRYALPIGAFVALRADVMRFGEVRDSSGVERTWDSDVDRLEAGAGYRFTRDVQGKVVWQRTTIGRDAAVEARHRLQLWAAQLSVRF